MMFDYPSDSESVASSRSSRSNRSNSRGRASSGGSRASSGGSRASSTGSNKEKDWTNLSEFDDVAAAELFVKTVLTHNATRTSTKPYRCFGLYL